MNILHVLSQFEVTGAEVYAVTLASAQQLRGHSVILISDTLNTSFEGVFISQPMGIRMYTQRFRNIKFLIRLIHEKDIHIIHAHSRAASWVCYCAAKLTNTPFVSTVHGRQHIHASSKAWSVYGNHIIVVSECLRDHLIDELGLNPKHITHIPNCLDIQQWLNTKSVQSKQELFNVGSNVPVILFVGRLSGPKGDVVRFLVSEVFPRLATKTSCVFHIIAGLKVPEDIPQMIQRVNQQIGENRVVMHTFQKDLAPFLFAADIIIGAGRVAIESLLIGKPTIAFGESGFNGLVTTKNFSEACTINFGDTGIRRSTKPQSVVDSLMSLLEEEQTMIDVPSLQKLASETFNILYIEKRISTVYQSAFATAKSPVSIPVLMYHRVVAEEPRGSHHGIWVTRSMFEQQLNILKQRGIVPITFEQYHLFLLGKFRLPRKPVILTFDDGYQDNYTHAFSLLKKYGVSAVIFLVTEPK